MDARTGLPSEWGARCDGSGAAIRPPLSRFLDLCHSEIAGDNSEISRATHPEIGERIIRNLAVLLAKRLILANRKIDLLTSY